MTAFDLFSIGHSNIPAERFVVMLHSAGVTAVADVRSTPASRFFPWFSAAPLRGLLAQHQIGYLPYGATLGGRPRDPALYRDGSADFEAMARQPGFAAALASLRADATRHRLCMMCAERDPLDCHRCLLVARALAGQGLSVGHILNDGSIEPQAATERRLLTLDAAEQNGGDLFATGQSERLAAAYRRRAHAVAYRAPGAKAIKGTKSKKRDKS